MDWCPHDGLCPRMAWCHPLKGAPLHCSVQMAHLTTLLQGAVAADVHQAVDKQLVDGHWVLSFSDAGAAQQAASKLAEAAAMLRGSIVNALGPLLACLA